MGNTNHTNNTSNVGKPTSHTQQGQAHERGAVRHRLTDAQLKLSKVNRIKEMILNSPDILELLK